MNKAREDARFGIKSDPRPTWQRGIEDMTEVRRTPIRGGISIEFRDKSGRGFTADVVGEEVAKLDRYEMQRSAVPVKANKPAHDVAKLSEAQIWDMNKSEQSALIKKLGGDKVPAKEQERVELIMKLQGA